MKFIGINSMSLADITSVTAGTGLTGGGTAGDVTLNVDASIPEITTLAGLTSFGSAGATTNILAGDIDWYNPVADGNPTLKFGFDDNERFALQPFYSGSSLATVIFKTATASATANMGKMRFQVDGTSILDIDDGGIDLDENMGISINGTDILTDSSGTATLSNIDALDGTTETTIESAIDTLANLTSAEALATVGTITTGVWQGTAIASAYLDADTAHLSGTQTFTGAKSFQDNVVIFDGDRSVTPGDGAAIHVDAHTVTDNDTSGSGTAAKYTHVNIEAPRLAATNSSVTTTSAASLYVQGAPTAHTNQTITNSYALWVDAGAAKFDGGMVGNVTGDLTGQADTVATIAGLAPNTATTQATQPAIESIGTDGDTLSILGDMLSMTNSTTTTPLIQLQNTTDDPFGPRLTMVNQRGGSAGANNDEVGKINFIGYDDQGTPAIQTYARILGEIHDATSGEESGRLTLEVANHDGGMGDGLILTGGSVDNEIDVTVGYGAASVVTIPGDIDLAGDIDVDGTLETDALTIGGAAVLAQATASAVGAVELATDAEAVTATDTTRAVTPANLKARVSQIVNLKGYATLQDDVYDFANSYNIDDEAPFQLDESYGSGTISSSTELAQSKFFRSGGFHVPFACTVATIQTQITCNNAGNVSIALVEYRPSDASGDQNDYPRTVYETVVNASDNTNNKVDTVTIATGDLDATAVPAGSHIMIMVKGDGTSAGGTLIVSVAIGLSW